MYVVGRDASIGGKTVQKQKLLRYLKGQTKSHHAKGGTFTTGCAILLKLAQISKRAARAAAPSMGPAVWRGAANATDEAAELAPPAALLAPEATPEVADETRELAPDAAEEAPDAAEEAPELAPETTDEAPELAAVPAEDAPEPTTAPPIPKMVDIPVVVVKVEPPEVTVLTMLEVEMAEEVAFAAEPLAIPPVPTIPPIP